MQARQPLRRVAREGQPAATRAALQRSCCAVRQDCARGHAELAVLASSNVRGLEEAHFSMFLHVLRCHSTPKKAKRDSGPFFSIFCGTVTCSQKRR